jgi:two-component system response regulator NreC
VDPIRILIADDHAVMRSGLRHLLNSRSDLEVVDEAGSGEEAIEKVSLLQPDVLLLDIAMPGMGGLEAARQIRERAPNVRIIVLTMYNDEAYLRQFLETGVSGFILKRAADTELVDAIRAAHRGESVVYPSLMQGLIDSYLNRPLPQGTPENAEGLSPREVEVLRLVALGSTARQISNRLLISVNTVETHRARIMRKLGLHSRVQLVRYAAAAGLLNEPAE